MLSFNHCKLHCYTALFILFETYQLDTSFLVDNNVFIFCNVILSGLYKIFSFKNLIDYSKRRPFSTITVVNNGQYSAAQTIRL